MHVRPSVPAQAAVSKENTWMCNFSGGAWGPCRGDKHWNTLLYSLASATAGKLRNNLNNSLFCLCEDDLQAMSYSGGAPWDWNTPTRPQPQATCSGPSRTSEDPSLGVGMGLGHATVCAPIQHTPHAGGAHFPLDSNPFGPIKLITQHILNCHLFVRQSLA